jgi:hypothetical protein
MNLPLTRSGPSSITTASVMLLVLLLLLLLLRNGTTFAQPPQQHYEMMDVFGTLKLYDSNPAKSRYDWQSKWGGSERTLKAGYQDPQDNQTVFKGMADGGVTIGSGESVHHPGTPRLFINKRASSSTAVRAAASSMLSATADDDEEEEGEEEDDAPPGFENVEFTAYANWKRDGNETGNAGFTMYGRSDHFNYRNDGCNAVGYYVKIWEGNTYHREGRIGFAKEYYHDATLDSTVYATVALNANTSSSSFAQFPKQQWIGIKFVIFTIPGTKSVQLEVYLDRTDGKMGGDWKLAHHYIDEPGGWETPQVVPSHCPIQNGDTILGERYSCVLRTDGGEVHWKKATVRHILPSYY